MKKGFLWLIMVICSLNALAQQPDIGCRMLEMIAKSGQIFEKPAAGKNIVLIDSLGVFSDNCRTSYKGSAIQVFSRQPADLQSWENVYFVINLRTEQDALIIAILQRSANLAAAFYFSISGNKVRIAKVRSGYF